MKIEVQTDRAPIPDGHCSQAVAHDGVLYLSMQLPVDPVTGRLPKDVKAQAAQLLDNCEEILLAGGSSLPLVLSVTVYLTDDRDWRWVDAELACRFGGSRPARGVLTLASLDLGAKVAMQMIAAMRPTGSAAR